MAHRLACELSDKVAAVAPIAGAVMVDCKPKRPVPVLFFHGTDDHGLPPAGGTNPRAGSRGPFPPLSKSIETWSRLDGCPSAGKETYRKGNVICTTYGPCTAGSEIEYCKINGGGHTWPGGEPIFEKKLGMTTKDISASAAMWDFFARHPIP
jgi:polyhydroxybutyrate depolymerase